MKLKGLVAYLSPVWDFGEGPKHETVTELNQSSTSQSGIRNYWNGPQKSYPGILRKWAEMKSGFTNSQSSN